MKNKIIIGPWSYLTGAILLAVLNSLLFALFYTPWQITTGITYWGAWIFKFFGGAPENWYYFANNSSRSEGLSQFFLSNNLSLMNLGIILGALLAVLIGSQFKVKKIKSPKQIVAALLGGIIMGYGTRIALGCNIGAFFSAIPSLSLSGWVWGISALAGAWVGSKLLIKYLL